MVMITNGWPTSSARKTEIVDVANGLTCSDMADFPVELYGAVGANLGGTPVVCGGSSAKTQNTTRKVGCSRAKPLNEQASYTILCYTTTIVATIVL